MRVLDRDSRRIGACRLLQVCATCHMSCEAATISGVGLKGVHLGAALTAVAGQVRDIYGVSNGDSHSLAHPGNPPMLRHDPGHPAVVEGEYFGIPA